MGESFLTDIGLDGTGTIEEASTAVLIEPEATFNPVGALSISLPISSSSLALSAYNYAVAYEVFDYSNNSYAKGIIPASELTIDDNSVTFESEYFGSFQVVRTQNKVSSRLSVVSDDRPLSKREVSNAEKALSLNPPSLSLNLPNRFMAVSASTSDNSLIDSCHVTVDSDMKHPFDKVRTWSPGDSLTIAPPSDSAMDLHARLSCKNKDGVRLKSMWSPVLLFQQRLT